MKNNDYLIEVMSIVGFTIVQIQRVESALSASWLMYAKRVNEEVPEFVFDGDFNELRQRNSKKMLGGFLRDIIASGQFKSSFTKRFERFINNRNRLIHRIFKEKAYTTFGRKRTIQQLHRFVSKLLNEGLFFEKVFDAYLGISYELLDSGEDYEVTNVDNLKDIMRLKRSNGDLDLLRKTLLSK